MFGKKLFAFLALLATTGIAQAQSSDPLSGSWSVQADGRNLIVLHLEGSAGQLSGTLTRPMGLNVGAASPAGTAVTEVKLPLYVAQVKESRISSTGRVFTLRFQDNPAGEIVLRSEGADQARIGFAANMPETALLPLVRIDTAAKVATDWSATDRYLIGAPARLPSAEMATLFAEDQRDRQGTVDWSVVTPRDEARRHRTRALLEAGQLRTADDYYSAAFVFQHGATPDDCLLAHVLAMAAMTLGRNDASWIATATLDRYLQRIDRSQVFGTQYVGVMGSSMTQGKYDTDLVPDSLRQLLGVPSREQQLERLKQFNGAVTGDR